MAQEIRRLLKGDGVYLHADDLAREILTISESLETDTSLTREERRLAAYVAERIALNCVGANLQGIEVTVGEIDFGA